MPGPWEGRIIAQMGLDEYQKKRKFDSTPEPRGAPRKTRGNRFVVQEHHSRRLHYDLRLEVEGVMKSWAVPKGPSMDPADKRLAVQTEDHPLEYATFHGVIPKGNYGAGEMSIWDSGTFEAEGQLAAHEQIARGELKFILYGKKLSGSFVLVKLHRSDTGRDWLLIKHRETPGKAPGAQRALGLIDAARKSKSLRAPSSGVSAARTDPKFPAGARPAEMPGYISPAKATLSERIFSDPGWLFEIKWDGVRAVARVKNNEVCLWSRAQREITQEYPELGRLAQNLGAHEVWIDGEVVALDSEGRSDFQLLQRRMSIRRPSAELLQKVPVFYYAFDILYCDGYDLREASLIDRKKFLSEILRTDEVIRYSDHQIEKGKELYNLAASQHLEGIVGKQMASPYPKGRATTWLKFKLDLELDAVVGGWTDPRGSREHFGALLLGLYEDRRLKYIGSVGTGFSGTLQERIMAQLEQLKSDRCPFDARPATRERAYWTRPELVARVRYGQMTEERHLRAPRFLGLREDGDPKSCTFDEQVSAKTLPDGDSEEKTARRPAENTRTGPALPTRTSLAAKSKIIDELERGNNENVFVDIDGRSLHLTHLHKVYFPREGYTKRNLLAYYYRVGPLLLPFLEDRPLVLRRYPDGINGEAFFQKDAGKGKGVPDWIKTVPIASEGAGRSIRYFIANDLPSLLYLVNLGCIDQNPWSSRYDDPEHPDYMFFDLDPHGRYSLFDSSSAGRNHCRQAGRYTYELFFKDVGRHRLPHLHSNRASIHVRAGSAVYPNNCFADCEETSQSNYIGAERPEKAGGEDLRGCAPEFRSAVARVGLLSSGISGGASFSAGQNK